MPDELSELVSAIEKTVKGSVSEGLEQVRVSLDESAAAVKSLEKSIKSSAIADMGEHVKTMDERWHTMGGNIKAVKETLEEVRDHRASVDKRLSALDKRSGKKADKIVVVVLIALACLALGFAVGFVLNSHWVRQQEETALQMRQAGFERELGEVFITGFKKAGGGDRKTLEKILLTGQRNEGYWKEVFSTIGDSAEERKKDR